VIEEVYYTTMATRFGEELNARIDLPLKGQLIERTVEKSSKNRLKWVDQIGYDLIDLELGYKVELKFASYSLVTERGKPTANTRIRVKNSRGSNKGIEIEHPADYYVICQENAMAIISFDDLRPHLVGVSDGIDAVIPHENLTFVFKNVEDANIEMESIKVKIDRVTEDHLNEGYEKVSAVQKREELNAAQ
jgi:hypothetical protein